MNLLWERPPAPSSAAGDDLYSGTMVCGRAGDRFLMIAWQMAHDTPVSQFRGFAEQFMAEYASTAGPTTYHADDINLFLIRNPR